MDSSKTTESYLVDATGFLIKPIDHNRLTLFLDKINGQKQTELIGLRRKDGIIFLNVTDIIFVEVFDHTIIYHRSNSKIHSRGSLSNTLSLLGKERFIQIHRSYLIQKSKIYSVKSKYPYSVTINKGNLHKDFPVSRKHIHILLDIFTQDILEKIL